VKSNVNYITDLYIEETFDGYIHPRQFASHYSILSSYHCSFSLSLSLLKTRVSTLSPTRPRKTFQYLKNRRKSDVEVSRRGRWVSRVSIGEKNCIDTTFIHARPWEHGCNICRLNCEIRPSVFRASHLRYILNIEITKWHFSTCVRRLRNTIRARQYIILKTTSLYVFFFSISC